MFSFRFKYSAFTDMITENTDHETMYNIMMYSVFMLFLDYHAHSLSEYFYHMAHSK